jgi:hypothetical protein
MTLTRAHRIYFAAVGLFAFWVGVWGYPVPGEIKRALPWHVPPLHARFIASMYFSATIMLLGAWWFARRRSEVTIVLPMTSTWTGWLLVVSLLHLSEFDFNHKPVWFWFFAYIVYPIVGAWLAWQDRAVIKASGAASGAARMPAWLSRAVAALGAICLVLAVLLFVMPTQMTTQWPWKISALLAQIYSGPFLAYGVGAVMIARNGGWTAARLPLFSLAAFAALVLLASYLHSGLFTAGSISAIVWFGGFAAALVLLGTGALMALDKGER